MTCLVLGSGPDALVAATLLARRGRRVVVLEAGPAVGGLSAPAEFAPGFRADAAGPVSAPPSPAAARALGLRRMSGPDHAAMLVGLFPDAPALVLDPDPARTREALKARSPGDGAAWDTFTRLVHRLAGFLGYLYERPAPRVTSSSAGDLFQLLGLGGRARRMGSADMVELLRVLPMSAAELLDDWFQDAGLKGLLGSRAVQGICQGPRSAGTALVMLHNQVHRDIGSFGGWTSGQWRAQLADAARAAGVEIRVGVPIGRILMEKRRVTGVAVEDGTMVEANAVISTLGARRTLFDLGDATALSPEFTRSVENIRYRGVQARLDLALDGVPRFHGADVSQPATDLVVAPDLDYVELAYDHAKYGEMSERPVLTIRLATALDPSLAPPGKQVLTVWMQYAPYHLRDGWDAAARARLRHIIMDTLERHAPGIERLVTGERLLTPQDYERDYGITEGSLGGAELGLDQILFMRPVPGWARYRTPIDGLYLAGVDTHPGPEQPGSSGRGVGKALRGSKGLSD